MRKVIVSMVCILGTLLVIQPMIGNANPVDYAEAKIVLTERADVYQTIGLQGQLSFADERYILSSVTGFISDICVEEGQRVAEAEALVRFGGSRQDSVISAFATEYEHIKGHVDFNREWAEEIMEQTVQRADAAYTIRQIMFQQTGGQVVAGTPLFRVSGTEQEVRCVAATADAEHIKPDMWGWISAEGVRLCEAVVKDVKKSSDETDGSKIVYMITLKPTQCINYDEGTAVQVDIYMNGSNDVVSLPIEAITESETVWWVSDEGMCTEIPARIILCDEYRAWVDLPEGLQIAVGEYTEGQRVVEAHQ